MGWSRMKIKILIFLLLSQLLFSKPKKIRIDGIKYSMSEYPDGTIECEYKDKEKKYLNHSTHFLMET
jgi:hypothetical protein